MTKIKPVREPNRQMADSTGIILPKPILAERGPKAGDTLDPSRQEGGRVSAPSATGPRARWADVAREIAEHGDDALAWPEFANAEDATLEW